MILDVPDNFGMVCGGSIVAAVGVDLRTLGLCCRCDRLVFGRGSRINFTGSVRGLRILSYSSCNFCTHSLLSFPLCKYFSAPPYTHLFFADTVLYFIFSPLVNFLTCTYSQIRSTSSIYTAAKPTKPALDPPPKCQ